MARLTKIPIEQAKEQQAKIPRRASVLEEYKKHILSLSPKEAGQFKVKDTQEAFKIRARLKRAAEALGVNLVIKKRGEYIQFYKED